MTNKFFFFLLILFLTNCGYQPQYSKNDNPNFIIGSVNLEGNKYVGRKIIPLLNLSIQKNKSSAYNLKLITNKNVETVAKDKNGNISIYRTTIDVTIKILEEEKVIKEKTFNEYFTYNNIQNNFDLSQYQMGVEENIVNKISNEIFIFLRTQ